jgi:2'-5' RNA ligase
MRLFVAIDLDDAARAAIAAEQKRIAAALRASSQSAVKWVRAEQMHLTLVFLGEVADARAPEITMAMRDPIATAPASITFGGVGVFPPRGRPTVLWIGVAAGAAFVAAVHQAVQTRAERLGFPPEQRPFHPHLTLARWRDSRERDRGHAAAAGSTRPIAEVHVDHVTLYQSRLGPAGPAYVELARATLTP